MHIFKYIEKAISNNCFVCMCLVVIHRSFWYCGRWIDCMIRREVSIACFYSAGYFFFQILLYNSVYEQTQYKQIFSIKLHFVYTCILFMFLKVLRFRVTIDFIYRALYISSWRFPECVPINSGYRHHYQISTLFQKLYVHLLLVNIAFRLNMYLCEMIGKCAILIYQKCKFSQKNFILWKKHDSV